MDSIRSQAPDRTFVSEFYIVAMLTIGDIAGLIWSGNIRKNFIFEES